MINSYQRYTYVLLIILLLPSCSFFERHDVIKPMPEILFKEQLYDFGIAGPGETIQHTFTFTNVGEKPLILKKIQTDCGCTAAMASEKTIQSGQTGEIETFFETKKFTGKQTKKVTVHTNDPDRSKIVLILSGIIKKYVAVTPEYIHFGNIQIGQSNTKRIKLLQLTQEELSLRKIEINNQLLTAKSLRFVDDNSRGFNIDITLNAKGTAGELNDVVTIHTNQKNRPRIDIPVWANVLGPIMITPASLSFGSAKKGEKISIPVILSHRNNKRFRILRMACDLPFIRLKSYSDSQKNAIKIYATIDEVSPAGNISTDIKVYTDNVSQKIIHIPLNGVIKN